MFYPVVHISRLKPVNEFTSRPTNQLAPEVAEGSGMDFGEALLPEDSWGSDHIAGEYEMEAIRDDRRPFRTSAEKLMREFKVKWLGTTNQHGSRHQMMRVVNSFMTTCMRKKSEHRFQMVQVADEDLPPYRFYKMS
ncbi:hypothetical protein PHMEG_00025552 [Phytophthora megakarya]|uniref:Reverse transcriptase n=1 Tax=Phytophthora megakarya TaxID=4795 RepID=A0A225VD70_9STRA|nr:hypothetical protein PHMEG_00025552 [Phytophthora megakarya]